MPTDCSTLDSSEAHEPSTRTISAGAKRGAENEEHADLTHHMKRRRDTSLSVPLNVSETESEEAAAGLGCNAEEHTEENVEHEAAEMVAHVAEESVEPFRELHVPLPTVKEDHATASACDPSIAKRKQEARSSRIPVSSPRSPTCNFHEPFHPTITKPSITNQNAAQ